MPPAKKAAKKRGVSTPERKTEALSIRIDPKVRYGLEMLSRLQRRSVTGVVEWSIIEAFRNNAVPSDDGDDVPFEQALDALWAVNELERLLRMHFYYPQLLTFEEERLVSVLIRTNALWNAPHHRRDFHLFCWTAALKVWDDLKRIAIEASDRSTVLGLTNDELAQAGLEHLLGPTPAQLERVAELAKKLD